MPPAGGTGAEPPSVMGVQGAKPPETNFSGPEMVIPGSPLFNVVPCGSSLSTMADALKSRTGSVGLGGGGSGDGACALAGLANGDDGRPYT